MKRILFLTGIVIACLFTACKKSGTNPSGNTKTGDTPIPQTWAADNTLSVSDTSYNSIAIQPDGKLLVADRHHLKRLNKDGSSDNSFTVGSPTDGQLYSLALQPDGKIWIGGNFYTYNSTKRNLVARLNADGSIDASTPNRTQLITYANGGEVDVIHMQSDGHVLIGGNFFYQTGPVTGDFGNGINGLIRLNSSGSLDDINPPQTIGTVKSMADGQSGKVFIAGYQLYTHDSALNSYYNMFRVYSDGSLDHSFMLETSGLTIGSTDPVNNKASTEAVFVQDDGKILVGGNFDAAGGNKKYQSIVRLNTDGALDKSFTAAPNLGDVTAIYRTADKRIFVGSSNNQNGAVTVLKDDGSIDSSVTMSFPRFGNVYHILPDADGNLLITGWLNETASSPMASGKGMIRIKKQ